MIDIISRSLKLLDVESYYKCNFKTKILLIYKIITGLNREIIVKKY